MRSAEWPRRKEADNEKAEEGGTRTQPDKDCLGRPKENQEIEVTRLTREKRASRKTGGSNYR